MPSSEQDPTEVQPVESGEDLFTIEGMTMASLLQELINTHPQGLTVAAYGNSIFYGERRKREDTEGELKIYGADVISPRRIVTNHELRNLAFDKGTGTATTDLPKDSTMGKFTALVGEGNGIAAAITVEGDDHYLMGVIDSLDLSQNQTITVLFYYAGMPYYPNIHQLVRSGNRLTTLRHRKISEQTPPQIT